MKKEIADKWVKALRSGEYNQTTETLQNGNGYCCLGVLCLLGQKEGVVVDSENSILVGDSLEDQVDVKEWSGIKTTCGKFAGGEPNLAQLNDEKGYDFNQLANVIEKEWDQL